MHVDNFSWATGNLADFLISIAFAANEAIENSQLDRASKKQKDQPDLTRLQVLFRFVLKRRRDDD
jgi:hypothetical protein